MIRYHDERGHLPGRSRAAGQHRQFDQADVEWLSWLQALVAAGVPTATAVLDAAQPAFEAVDTQLSQALRRRGVDPTVLRRQLQLLSATLRALLPEEPGGPDEADEMTVDDGPASVIDSSPVVSQTASSPGGTARH